MNATEKQFMDPNHLINLLEAYKDMCDGHIAGHSSLELVQDGYIYYLEATKDLSINITYKNDRYQIKFKLSIGEVEAEDLDHRQAAVLLTRYLTVVFCALADQLSSNHFEYCKWLNAMNSQLLALIVYNNRNADMAEVREIINKLPRYIHDRVDKIAKAS